MKRFKFFEKTPNAKTVYIMAGVSFLLTAVAVGVVYSRTMSTLEENLAFTKTTNQVGLHQQGESDPRTTKATTEKTTTTTTTLETVTEDLTTTQQPTQKEVAATTLTEEKQSFMLPCDGEIIRAYSPEIPVYCKTMEDWRTHSGVDFAVGDDGEVLSVGKGKVSKVLVDSTYGYTVEVDYGEFTARYCGLEQGTTAVINQLLNKGDSVGKVGTVPCEVKSGKHLHFEVVKDGDTVDPVKELTQ